MPRLPLLDETRRGALRQDLHGKKARDPIQRDTKLTQGEGVRPEVLEQHRDHCGIIRVEYATSLLRHAAQGEGQWTEALEREPINEYTVGFEPC